jgi:hypothetical protein
MGDTAGPAPPPLWRRILRGVLRAPLVVLVTLYFLFEDLVVALVRPVERALAELALFERLGRFLRALGPYQTLAFFAVPYLAFEGPKLYALYLIATGHGRFGTILLVVSHVASIVVVERLFHVTRDKLLTIRPIAIVHGWGVRLRDWAFGIVRATRAWSLAVAFALGAKAAWAKARRDIAAVALRFGRWLRRAGRL